MDNEEREGLTSAVVIPVRGHGALLEGALAALASQSHPVQEIVIVDDSSEGSLGTVDGATVVRSGGGGPYKARNVGWRTTGADVVLFMDARSRPRPSWSQRLVSCFDDPAVALAGSDTFVLEGPSWAARTAAALQIFALERYYPFSFSRPYFPTCNLAVRRNRLVEVGGFSEKRSGADAELCWRVQDLTGTTIEARSETLMEWIPRDNLSEFIEQYYRYGRSNYRLRQQGTAGRAVPTSWVRLGIRSARLVTRLATARIHDDDATVVKELCAATNMAYAVGLRAAHDGELVSRTRSRARSLASDILARGKKQFS